MNERQLFATATFCFATFPPLVGFYGVWPAFTQWLLQYPARAFMPAFAFSLAFAVAGTVSAISTSPGEHK
ncbi:MAG: hypothetical protein EPN47_18390 [Acidobacteria bacterium]|nr:MAG: hypothetical protein EPN47_18390 [Acidobacteriota bacterium]